MRKQTYSKPETEKTSKTLPVDGPPSDEARDWLRANGYDDIADTIDQVMATWKAEGKATRRNWWEILAGNPDGSPRIAGGVTFPVLRSARIRQGLPDSPAPIQRNPNEVPPPIRVTPRWSTKRRSRKKKR